ncbi:hypothetical protein BOW53_09770 [Solemya pervernicosa gill symbiont]|uniref:Uncharacterized protein n=1 Tax=Solemya pervernicosa gill symbiont TaxID=642797 RepID=A0A1T2L462_9GAMM|nr:hypothetical protein [Solemya pervernicosa gill symbiont]OOZ39883.1 hypothetical protein BOW53_09770 [Solemya pervernicosa gill symbiont]
MNVDKCHKRIEKKVKRGFQGYPLISVDYYGPDDSLATKVIVGFVAEEGFKPQQQEFETEGDIREEVNVQTTILKLIERTEAKTVTLSEGVTLLAE